MPGRSMSGKQKAAVHRPVGIGTVANMDKLMIGLTINRVEDGLQAVPGRSDGGKGWSRDGRVVVRHRT